MDAIGRWFTISAASNITVCSWANDNTCPPTAVLKDLLTVFTKASVAPLTDGLSAGAKLHSVL